jgi:predicted unusual protein kinase regulating ubiquinone biosynthesis (AarF/ABC1/UbiB family)
LIGADSFDGHVMNHEIAHGLYYTNKQYKKNCDDLISKIKKKDYNLMKKKLLEIGYSNDKKIIDDEIQAFMSTGLYNKFSGEELEKYEQSFIDNFKNF